MLGKPYLLEHCLSEFRKRQETKIFREYVCESLKLHGENKYLTAHYTDLITPQETENKEKQFEKAEKIAANIHNLFEKGDGTHDSV